MAAKKPDPFSVEHRITRLETLVWVNMAVTALCAPWAKDLLLALIK